MYALFLAILHVYAVGCTIAASIFIWLVWKEYRRQTQRTADPEELSRNFTMERVDGMFRLYEAATCLFILQAKTKQALINEAKKMYPGHTLYIEEIKKNKK